MHVWSVSCYLRHHDACVVSELLFKTPWCMCELLYQLSQLDIRIELMFCAFISKWLSFEVWYMNAATVTVLVPNGDTVHVCTMHCCIKHVAAFGAWYMLCCLWWHESVFVKFYTGLSRQCWMIGIALGQRTQGLPAEATQNRMWYCFTLIVNTLYMYMHLNGVLIWLCVLCPDVCDITCLFPSFSC